MTRADLKPGIYRVRHKEQGKKLIFMVLNVLGQTSRVVVLATPADSYFSKDYEYRRRYLYTLGQEADLTDSLLVSYDWTRLDLGLDEEI